MPILWRYLLFGFLRIFSLSACSFVLILLVSRFKEIARFGALSASLGKTLLFALYQAPLILPIALPLSALIASLLLFQKMSRSFELTALRASGIRLSTILTPVLLASVFLGLLTFNLCAEISPFCRRATKELIYYETSSNPLVLLQRQNLIKAKDSYIKMRLSNDGKIAKDLFLITHNQSQDRLSLVSAKKLSVLDSQLEGHDVALITHIHPENPENFDSLVIENQSWMTTDASALSSTLKKHRPRLDPASLELPMLRLHGQEKAKIAKKSFVDILRRITLSCAVFTFTLLGCAYGIGHVRNPSRKNLFKALGLALGLMMSYLLGKEFKGAPLTALAIFLLPHPLLWTLSIRKVNS